MKRALLAAALVACTLAAGCSAATSRTPSTTATTTTVGPPPFATWGFTDPIKPASSGKGPGLVSFVAPVRVLKAGVWCYGPGSVTIVTPNDPFKPRPDPLDCGQFHFHSVQFAAAVGSWVTLRVVVAPQTRWVAEVVPGG